MCFPYNQVGHKKTECRMLRGGVVSAPTLVTLRITNGREARVGVPAASSRALQCQSEEDRVSLDVVAAILSFVFLSCLIISIYIFFGILSRYV